MDFENDGMRFEVLRPSDLKDAIETGPEMSRNLSAYLSAPIYSAKQKQLLQLIHDLRRVAMAQRIALETGTSAGPASAKAYTKNIKALLLLAKNAALDAKQTWEPPSSNVHREISQDGWVDEGRLMRTTVIPDEQQLLPKPLNQTLEKEVVATLKELELIQRQVSDRRWIWERSKKPSQTKSTKVVSHCNKHVDDLDVSRNAALSAKMGNSSMFAFSDTGASKRMKYSLTESSANTLSRATDHASVSSHLPKMDDDAVTSTTGSTVSLSSQLSQKETCKIGCGQSTTVRSSLSKLKGRHVENTVSPRLKNDAKTSGPDKAKSTQRPVHSAETLDRQGRRVCQQIAKRHSIDTGTYASTSEQRHASPSKVTRPNSGSRSSPTRTSQAPATKPVRVMQSATAHGNVTPTSQSSKISPSKSIGAVPSEIGSGKGRRGVEITNNQTLNSSLNKSSGCSYPPICSGKDYMNKANGCSDFKPFGKAPSPSSTTKIDKKPPCELITPVPANITLMQKETLAVEDLAESVMQHFNFTRMAFADINETVHSVNTGLDDANSAGFGTLDVDDILSCESLNDSFARLAGCGLSNNSSISAPMSKYHFGVSDSAENLAYRTITQIQMWLAGEAIQAAIRRSLCQRKLPQLYESSKLQSMQKEMENQASINLKNSRTYMSHEVICLQSMVRRKLQEGLRQCVIQLAEAAMNLQVALRKEAKQAPDVDAACRSLQWRLRALLLRKHFLHYRSHFNK